MKTDSQLKREVEDELDWDPAVTSADIGVEVTNRVVTLSGHPPSFAEKLAAEKAAQRVAGVKAVVVEMQVRLPKHHEHGDEELANAVRAILHWSVVVPDDSVKVQVEKGWVTLTGSVDWAYQRQIVARAVGHMRGLRGMTNAIEVRSRAVSEDIVGKIAAAMQRHAQREVKHIGIHVKDGTVTLTGRVGSCAERAVARGVARSAPGVRAVVDDLVVE
ncbi:osmotically-inducible protein OsmY [Paraburkholderia atlantica]|uniref:Osmotically-inducible protein OsmY n=1 Tax=Paraburkholderia atlantica TaxID=2654982 RepID=A0A6I1Q2V7_PARAM|nr:BON domain-containing protein [Paraburkholderia atlantica]MBB5428955.1 osmotically-inducible protein OsmY [Paraburkholderia atlantica]MPW08431.1 BON domain-containing protein [Paraburkholderia atlantica]NUY35660.1 BON domain-containing protein [Paraburkholderia atlantica]